MPCMDIQILEGVFTPEEKAQMIEKLTDAFGEIAGQTLAGNLSVRIHEVKSGSWGYAGKALTTEVGLSMRARG